MYEESNSRAGSRRVSQREISTFLVLFGTLLSGPTTTADAQDLQWAKQAGGTSSDEGRGIVTDAAGNSVVTGAFRGTATFGLGEVNETTLTSPGSTDVFVAKYAPDGSLVWAKQAGGADSASGQGIAIDAAGNYVVTGAFRGTATFGPGEVNETMLTSASTTDVFVAKYDPDGALLWAKRAGGTDLDRGAGIAIDAAGNSVVTGLFGGMATFGPGEVNETTLTSASAEEVFVAKYAPDGSLVWAKQASGTSFSAGDSIATDAAGNGVVTGFFRDMATFGPGEVNETTLTSAGESDVFVAKYAPDGSLVWAKQAGGPSFDLSFGIATDAAGNSVVAGGFRGMATFGSGEANETTLTSASGGDDDAFVAKYAPDGSLLWAKQAGGTGSARGQGIATDAAGNSVVTGFFAGMATFGPGEVNETTLTTNGLFDPDVFVAAYAPDGSLLWAKQVDASGPAEGHDVATNLAGNSVVTGRFIGTATFGPGEANETMLTSAGESDAFVARYAGAPFCVPATTDYGTFGCGGTSQAASTSDLDDYVASDFGRNGGNRYKNLKIVGDIDAGAGLLDIESPCKVTYANNVVVSAAAVRVRGRTNVNGGSGYEINSPGPICIFSEEGNAEIGSKASASGASLTLQSEKAAKIGSNATVAVSGDVVLRSTGNVSASDALVLPGAVVNAQSLSVIAAKTAALKPKSLVQVSGGLCVLSTTDASGSLGIEAGGLVCEP